MGVFLPIAIGGLAVMLLFFEIDGVAIDPIIIQKSITSF